MKDRASQDEALTTELGKHPFPNGNPLNKLQEKKKKQNIFLRILVLPYQIQELVKQRSLAQLSFFNHFCLAKEHTHAYKNY